MEQKFTDFTQKFWQNALRKRVLVEGEHDEELYNRAVALYTAEGGVYEACFDLGFLPPKLTVYTGGALPEGVQAVDEDRICHIPMGGSDEAVNNLIWAACESVFRIGDDGTERTTEGVRINVTKQQQIDQDRDKDKPRERNNGKIRSRDMFAVLEAPKHIQYFANTWGQNRDWKEFKEESPEAWQIFLNNRFSDEVMEAFSGTANITIIHKDGTETVKENFPLWKYWLRSLRVMNGLSTTDMGEYLGIIQSNYSAIENEKRYYLDLTKIQPILDRNLFGLPLVMDAGGRRHIDFIYAKRFTQMVENEICLPDYLKPQLFAAVKGIAEAYLRGDYHGEDENGVTLIERMPSLNALMVLQSNDKLGGMFGGKKGSLIKSGGLIPHPYLAETSVLYQLGGVDYTPYFAAMPYYSLDKKKNIASPALSQDQAFELAVNTQTTGLGNFLEIFRESTGQSLKDVEKNMDVSAERLRQLEKDIKKNGKTNNKSYESVAKLLSEANPYGLPVDENGKIRSDVVEYIHKIHIPPRGTTGKKSQKEEAMIAQAKADKDKWLGFGEVASKVFAVDAFLVQESSREGAIIRPPLTPNPEWDSLRAVWEKAIIARVEPLRLWQEGTLTIGSNEVRYKREKGGEYLLHADGLLAIRAALMNAISPSK